jgi:hypothetical protein
VRIMSRRTDVNAAGLRVALEPAALNSSMRMAAGPACAFKASAKESPTNVAQVRGHGQVHCGTVINSST